MGIEFPTERDRKGIQQIAALLPILVAHKRAKDRWVLEELLERLRWDSPFKFRHGHTFPIDAFYEKNDETNHALAEALRTAPCGYIGLTGPPGSGRSRLLSAGVLPSPRARVLKYLAYVPGQGQGVGSGEAVDFLSDLLRQFKGAGLEIQMVPGSELHELRAQFGQVLLEAYDELRREGLKTIIVVDGLDHVLREERPTRSKWSLRLRASDGQPGKMDESAGPAVAPREIPRACGTLFHCIDAGFRTHP